MNQKCFFKLLLQKVNIGMEKLPLNKNRSGMRDFRKLIFPTNQSRELNNAALLQSRLLTLTETLLL